ncbi:4Fe-4S binding protein, partial [Candidatus Bathyarchaeota archaeon]|nr:4Fe-4S binding protein [Candidatus Bathyarchaeota archaeon]
MPMKTQKITTDNQLIIERRHHAKTYKLTIDQASCVGCELCSLICPREAIKVTKKPKIEGEKAERPTIDVDEAKCHYCGMCVAICPYGAVHVAVDGENISSVVEKESFPQLIREISVDTTKCPTDCKECEEVCPLNLIKIEANSIKAQVTVEILKERCPCCGLCDVKCPEGAIRVRRIFTGKLRIDQE